MCCAIRACSIECKQDVDEPFDELRVNGMFFWDGLTYRSSTRIKLRSIEDKPFVLNLPKHSELLKAFR